MHSKTNLEIKWIHFSSILSLAHSKSGISNRNIFLHCDYLQSWLCLKKVRHLDHFYNNKWIYFIFLIISVDFVLALENLLEMESQNTYGSNMFK